MKVLGIDPGITTGLAVVSAWSGCSEKARISVGVAQATKFPDTATFARWLDTEIKVWQLDAVVCEKYNGGAGGSLQSDVNRLIGAVEAVCAIRNIPLALQINTERRVAQKKADAISTCPSVHARDALAHALTHLWKVGELTRDDIS